MVLERKQTAKIVIIAITFLHIVSCHQKYVLFFDRVNWYQALINCRSKNLDLVGVHSDYEQAELEQFLNSQSMYERRLWLGATNEGNENFYWLTSGTKMVYTRWLLSQPNNASHTDNFYRGERCVAIDIPYTEPIGWNDVTCFNKLPYICQSSEHCFPV